MNALTDFQEICNLPTYPPDGKYVATITHIDTFRRAISKPHVKFYLRVTEGEYAGHFIPKVMWLHTASGHTQFVKEMRQIGFSINRLDDLESNESFLKRLTIVIGIRRKVPDKEPQIYFLKRG